MGYTAGLTSASYTYNPDGLRRTKTTTGMPDTQYVWSGGYMVYECELLNPASGTVYVYGVNLIFSKDSAGAKKYYLYNAHGDVVQLLNSSKTLVKSYKYDAFGVEYNIDPNDTNPFRYCGEYFDKETGTYYLRARYYNPANGRFTSADTHWNVSNMIYGDNPTKINESKSNDDKLGLNTYTYVPDIIAIMQNGNLYLYCIDNPILYHDDSGSSLTLALAGTGSSLGAGVTFGGANFWNPVGWLALGVVAVIGIYYGVQYANDKATQKAISILDLASTTATPPPPNDPNSKGTQTSSKTLYNKNGTRIDVENPGNRPGQIHVHQGNSKYIYDVASKSFITSGGQAAPNSVQQLLNNPDIIKAIAKGLTYLGY